MGPDIDAMRGIAKASKNRSLADFQAVSFLCFNLKVRSLVSMIIDKIRSNNQSFKLKFEDCYKLIFACISDSSAVSDRIRAGQNCLKAFGEPLPDHARAELV